MRRRCVLTSLGAVVVAGCTGSGGSGTTTTAGGATTGGTTDDGGATLVTASLSVSDVGCGSESDGGASVSFEESALQVSGSVVGSNGCYRARLGEVSVDSSSDTCRVVVQAFDDSGPDGGCNECITVVSYDVRVVFDGGVPGTVMVVHDDLGGEHTVATEDS